MPPLSPDRQLSWTAVSIGSGKTLRVGTSNMSFQFYARRLTGYITGSDMKIPTFEELPIRKDLPAESSWGVFGDNDALGCLNFLTPEGVVEAARRRHIGIEEVPAVRAEGMNIPPLAIHAVPNGEKAIEAVVF